MPHVPHKKIKLIIQSARHVIRKGELVCHVSENAQSAGLGWYSKKNNLQRTESVTPRFPNVKIS